MSLHKKSLPINQLKSGMISADNIKFNNTTLIAKDVAINQAAIDTLSNNYIVTSVNVYVEDDSDEPINSETNSVKELENTLNEFSSDLTDIFSTLSNISSPRIDEIRVFSRRIQSEFQSTGLVIKNILFYGSGNDTIYRHSINVSAICYVLGKWLKLDDNELNLLTYSAVLHDFGKVKIDKSILCKGYKMSTNEYEIFKTHPVIGYNYIKKIQYLDSSVGYGVLMHHERNDGSGYPLGVKDANISKFAKIIAIADIFDEVCSNRYIRKVSGPFEALQVIQEESFARLDCNFCNVFLSHIIDYFMGENVLLSDNRTCKVIQVHLNNLTKPLLLGDNGFVDLEKEKNVSIVNLVV